MSRPNFQALWDNHPNTLYPNIDLHGAYALVGGNALDAYESNKYAYGNSCALKMSWAFNQSGHTIPSGTIILGKNIYRLKGRDGKPYIMRVREFNHYFEHVFGVPDLILGPDDLDKITGKKGIMSLSITGFSDAGGHIVLWNGFRTVDNSPFHIENSQYYIDRPSISLQKIHFWELK